MGAICWPRCRLFLGSEVGGLFELTVDMTVFYDDLLKQFMTLGVAL